MSEVLGFHGDLPVGLLLGKGKHGGRAGRMHRSFRFNEVGNVINLTISAEEARPAPSAFVSIHSFTNSIRIYARQHGMVYTVRRQPRAPHEPRRTQVSTPAAPPRALKRAHGPATELARYSSGGKRCSISVGSGCASCPKSTDCSSSLPTSSETLLAPHVKDSTLPFSPATISMKGSTLMPSFLQSFCNGGRQKGERGAPGHGPVEGAVAHAGR